MTVENNAMSPMQRADFQPRFLPAAAALLIVPWCCLVSAAQQTEAETAYIQRFEERFPPVAIVPDLEFFAATDRYDELYLGTNLDQALEDDLSHGGLTVQLGFTLAAANEVFEREDLARFARTATEGFARLKGGVLLGSVNGDPASNPAYVGGATAWLALADSHPEVGRSIVEHYVRYVPVPPPHELARLVEQRMIETSGRDVHNEQPATGRRETE